MDLTPREIEIVLLFLKQQHQKAYFAALDHLDDYRAFMKKQNDAWKEIQKFDESLIIPSSIECPSLQKLKIESVVDEYFDGDSMFDSPTAEKVIESWLDTPSKICENLSMVYTKME